MIYPTVTVVGGSEAQRKLVRQAARYFLKKLMYERDHITLAGMLLSIELIKDLHKSEDVKGDLEPDDDDSYAFDLRLDSSMNISALLRTLAHECVHASQYALEDMKETRNVTVTIWKGKRIDWSKMHYYDQPWEIDAYGKEIGLYEGFVGAKRLTRESWYIDYDYE